MPSTCLSKLFASKLFVKGSAKLSADAIVQRGDIIVTKIASTNNLADPFAKSLSAKSFDRHVEGMGLKYMSTWF